MTAHLIEVDTLTGNEKVLASNRDTSEYADDITWREANISSRYRYDVREYEPPYTEYDTCFVQAIVGAPDFIEDHVLICDLFDTQPERRWRVQTAVAWNKRVGGTRYIFLCDDKGDGDYIRHHTVEVSAEEEF